MEKDNFDPYLKENRGAYLNPHVIRSVPPQLPGEHTLRPLWVPMADMHISTNALPATHTNPSVEGS